MTISTCNIQKPCQSACDDFSLLINMLRNEFKNAGATLPGASHKFSARAVISCAVRAQPCALTEMRRHASALPSRIRRRAQKSTTLRIRVALLPMHRAIHAVLTHRAPVATPCDRSESTMLNGVAWLLLT